MCRCLVRGNPFIYGLGCSILPTFANFYFGGRFRCFVCMVFVGTWWPWWTYASALCSLVHVQLHYLGPKPLWSTSIQLFRACFCIFDVLNSIYVLDSLCSFRRWFRVGGILLSAQTLLFHQKLLHLFCIRYVHESSASFHRDLAAVIGAKTHAGAFVSLLFKPSG